MEGGKRKEARESEREREGRRAEKEKEKKREKIKNKSLPLSSPPRLLSFPLHYSSSPPSLPIPPPPLVPDEPPRCRFRGPPSCAPVAFFCCWDWWPQMAPNWAQSTI